MKEIIRRIKKDEIPFIEKAVYIQAGEEGTDINDSRKHSIQGEEGEWILIFAQIFFGAENYDVTVDFTLQVDPSVTIISEIEYNSLIATNKQVNDAAKQGFMNQAFSDKNAKEARLKGQFQAGKIFPGDSQTFIDTYGFDPTV